MKKKICTFLIFLLLISAGCSNSSSVNNNENFEKETPTISQNLENPPDSDPTPVPTLRIVNTIDLKFEPCEIKPLPKGKPDERWPKVYSVYYGNLPDQKEATISFYWDNQTEKYPDYIQDIYVYLEAGGETYDLGFLTSFGFNGINNIEAVDLTNDGIKEFFITGDVGATYQASWVIGFKDGQWYKLLDYSNLSIRDLDSDGMQELTATSFGSLPPFVEILRWNGNCFEKVDVTDHTKMDYATLSYEYDNWIISSGKSSESYYYIYKDGKLHQIDLNEEEQSG